MFPVAATITLPGISISPQQLNFGKCHLGNNVNQSLLLLNSNPVAALWSVKVLEPGQLLYTIKINDHIVHIIYSNTPK